MTNRKSNESRRKALKSLALGGGAVVAGKSLPESWAKPIVDTVLLPAHAETTGAPVETNYSQTQGFEHTGESNSEVMEDQRLTFTLGGVTPIADGTVTISNLAGDLSDGADEVWIIMMNGVELGRTNNSSGDCEVAPGSVFNVTKAALLAAISGDSIVITAVNGGDIDTFCGPDGENGPGGGPGESNRMDVTLAFLAQA